MMDALGKTVIRSVTHLLAPHFEPIESWYVWLAVVLPILYGLPIDSKDLPTFQRATGRKQLFQGPIDEAWFLCGRRSGKSRFLALMAVVYALFRDYKDFIGTGERPMVMILAADREQAQVIFNYALALIQETEMLAEMIENPKADTIELTNGVSIAVHTSSYKSVRGRTLAAALCDEAAFWRSDDSRNPAEAVIRALRPALSTIPHAPLLVASSTYSQDGVLYDAFAKHFGKDSSNVMVWKADTRTMNPTFRQEVIDAAYASDAAAATAEYGSEWMTDSRAFLPDDLINDAIVNDRRSLPRLFNTEHVAFCDPSGGVHDEMVLAIAHQESGLVVLDRLESVKPPFTPEEVTQRFADILSSYGLTEVTGDRYASTWVSSMFRKFGITYKASEIEKSQIYIAAQPLFSQKVVELLDIPKLAGEFRRLERRPRSGGRDMVDHPRGSHDDNANAVAGALVLASKMSAASRSSRDFLTPGRHVRSDYDPMQRFMAEQERSDGYRH